MIVHADDLEREIAAEQEALGENLAELEHRAKDLVDWRALVRKRPGAMIGIAFGGALLVAAMGGSRRSRSGARTMRERHHESNGDGDASAARDAWAMFKGAVVGAATTRVTSYVAGLLPGSHEHLEEQRRERAAKRQKSRSGSAGSWDSEAGSYI
jgi:hypothetical protein